MESKAQAGIEYLVTYGWALILIATVIGAFFFLSQNTAKTIACTTSDEQHFLCKGAFLEFSESESNTGYMAWSGGRAALQVSQNWPVTIESMSYSVSQGNTTTLLELPDRIRQQIPCGNEKGYYYIEFLIPRINGHDTTAISNSPLRVEGGAEIILDGIEFRFWHNGKCDFSFEKLEEIKAEPVAVTLHYTDRLGLENKVSVLLENFPAEDKRFP